jgi:hypothetical protein
MRIRTAVDAYVNDVRAGTFPSAEESFSAEPAAPVNAPVYSTVTAKKE